MCGICGYIGKREIEEYQLRQMNDSMSHRGPDDEGIYRHAIGNGYYMGMGHRRLSILDLSESGHQPMIDVRNQYAIVFNGEIYNYREIKNDLKKCGYIFSSESDTEVLLYAYIEYGNDVLKRLNGMFAFAVWDEKKQTMLLARDRIGKKPLYYYHNNDDFVFASELKPIMMNPVFKKNIRMDIINRYLCQSTIIPPDTIFENTYKLCPGEYVLWKNGAVQKAFYWNVLGCYEENVVRQEKDYSQCKKNLKALLYDSVEKRLLSDVPVGTFLSGGIDSTLVSAVANDLVAGGVDTFTIGFENEKFDESPYARESAKYLGTRHHEIIMTERQMLDMMDSLPRYFDEPFADSSQLPMMLVSMFAKKDVTVALSGDGGDEFFCGYTAYSELNKMQILEYFLKPARERLSREFVDHHIRDDRIRALFNNRDSRYQIQIYSGMREEIARAMISGESIPVRYDCEAKIKASDWREKGMLLDMMTYLPDDILTKADRASMRYSLEVRCPLLDQRIMEYSFRIPMKYKYHKGKQKYILKDILYDFIPEEMMNRKKKGFAVPIAAWLRTSLKSQLLQYAEKKQLKQQGIFNAEKVQEVISLFMKSDRYLYCCIVWSFFVFQMWYKEYIDDLWNA